MKSESQYKLHKAVTSIGETDQMSNQTFGIHFHNFQILDFFNNFFIFNVFKKISYFLKNFIAFRFLVPDLFNHNMFILNVFERFCCFFKFGLFIFFALCDVSYLHRRLLSKFEIQSGVRSLRCLLA